MAQWLLVALAAAILAGCGATRSSVVVQHTGHYDPARAPSAAPPGGAYRVAKGDTLYSIAFRNRVDFRDLAHWNGIEAPYTIWPGQTLRLSPAPGTSAKAPVVVAARPAPAPVHPAPAAPPPVAPAFETVHDGDMAPAPTASSVVPATAGTVAAAGATMTPGPISVPTATPPPVPVVPPPAAVAAATPIVAGASRQAAGIAWRWPADGSLIKKFQAGDAIPGIEVAGKNGDPVRAAADGVVVYSGNGLVGYGELVIIKHNDSFLSAYGHNRKRLVKEGERVKAGQMVAEMGSSGATRDELQFQIRRDGNPVDPLQYLPPR
jgi:lipoprotein NlpD